ncbi:hypothetical protein BB561_001675 [Smittium simulii]|uniref:Transporter n=1 Tax=Smittium simulii TaxID=133385 RepID=A0A2T9YTJ8_9FUNG|nr:hypothetical protein BB561_001675 [Smittium simulii]
MFLSYFIIASRAIAKIALVGLCGYYFSYKGILNKSALRTISVLSVELFTPCLLYSKMIETLDKEMLMELSRILKIDKEYRRLLMVAVFFSNTNSLPLSLIQSILISPGAIFLKKDPLDTSLKMSARGISYTLIFATLNNLLRWSLGVALMGENNNKSAPIKNKSVRSAFHSTVATPNPYRNNQIDEHTLYHINTSNHDQQFDASASKNQTIPEINLPVNPIHEQSSKFVSPNSLNKEPIISMLTPTIQISHTDSFNLKSESTENLTPYQTLQNSPPDKIYKIANSEALFESSETERLLDSENDNIQANNQSSIYNKIVDFFLKFFTKLNSYLTAPVYAIIFGVISVVIPVIKDTFLDPNSAINFIYSAIDLCGEACVPLVIISLGGQLAQVPKVEKKDNDGSYLNQNFLIVGIHKLRRNFFSIFTQKSSITNNENNLEAVNRIQYDSLNTSCGIIVNSSKSPNINNPSTLELSYDSIESHSKFNDIERGLGIDNPLCSSSLLAPKKSIIKKTKTIHNKNKLSDDSKLKLNNKKSNSQITKIDKHVCYDNNKLYIFGADNSTEINNVNIEADKISDLSNEWSDSDNDLDSESIKSNESINNFDYVSPKDEKSGVVVVLLGRFCFVPICAIGILLGMKTFLPSFAKLLSEDPVFFFTLLVLSSTPPAINLITLVQAKGKFEDQAAHILMWSYLVGIFVLSAEVGIFMWFTNRVFN